MATPLPRPSETPDEELARLLGGEHRRRALTLALIKRIHEIRRSPGEAFLRIATSSDGKVRGVHTWVPESV